MGVAAFTLLSFHPLFGHSCFLHLLWPIGGGNVQSAQYTTALHFFDNYTQSHVCTFIAIPMHLNVNPCRYEDKAGQI